MGNQWKINALQNYRTRDEFNKLTFKKGDAFSARILRLEGNEKDVIIKLLDGRVFPAMIEGDISEDKLNNYLFKFQLTGFSGGKFELSIIESSLIEKLNEGSGLGIKDPLMEELLKNLDFPISKEDVPVLKAMLKNHIPLTEGNLLEIKGANELIERSNNSSFEIDKFIDGFLESKGIQPGSHEGKEMKTVLNNVFSELKNLSSNDVLLMKSLGIKLTAEDIKAFANVTSNQYNISEEVKDINTIINTNGSGANKEILENPIENSLPKVEVNKDQINKDIKSTNELTKEVTITNLENDKIDINKDNKNTEIKSEKFLQYGEGEKEIDKGFTVKEEILKDNQKIKGFETREISAAIIKEEVKEKISTLKSDILSILKLEEKNSQLFSSVAQLIENKFHEIKMYNHLNDNYYMLNLPIKSNNEECDCKLIIKDERGKGKKIDSQNIKIAASVDTIHMNKIDAYITIKGNAANIEIESDKIFVNILDKFKGKLLDELSNDNYIFNIAIKEKKEDFSFSNCRTFFEDNEFSTINTRV